MDKKDILLLVTKYLQGLPEDKLQRLLIIILHMR